MYTKVAVVPALTLAAYTANDCVGALLTFTGAGNIDRHESTIRRLTLIDKAMQNEEYYLYLFNESPAAAARTDADPFAPVAADFAKMICSIHIAVADYLAGNACSIVLKELNVPLLVPGTAVYGVLVAVATPDYAAVDDLTLALVVQ